MLAGGGTLHRATLSDAVLIKDTHVRIAGGVTTAVERVHEGGLPVEVEVETIAQLEEALAAGAERILLDNFEPAQVREAVALVATRCGSRSPAGCRSRTCATTSTPARAGSRSGG